MTFVVYLSIYYQDIPFFNFETNFYILKLKEKTISFRETLLKSFISNYSEILNPTEITMASSHIRKPPTTNNRTERSYVRIKISPQHLTSK